MNDSRSWKVSPLPTGCWRDSQEPWGTTVGTPAEIASLRVPEVRLR